MTLHTPAPMTSVEKVGSKDLRKDQRRLRKEDQLSINSFETCFTDSFFLLAGDKLKTVDSCCF